MRQIGMVLIALACGLVATIAVSQVMKNNGNTPAGPATEPIFVAVADVDIGEAVDSEKVRLEEWPKDRVPLGAIRNIEDLEGRFARQRLYPGEPILGAKLMDNNSDNNAIKIPEGFRVCSIKVTMDSAVSSLINPGDRVDIIAYLRKSADIPMTTAKTILRDVRIFAVNSETTRQVDNEGQVTMAKTVSLLVKPPQAELIMLASQLGKLQLSLRHPDDTKDNPVGETTVDNLLRGGGELADTRPISRFLGGLFSGPKTADATPGLPSPEPAADVNFVMQVWTPDGVSQYQWQNEDELPLMMDEAPDAPTPARIDLPTPAQDDALTAGDQLDLTPDPLKGAAVNPLLND